MSREKPVEPFMPNTGMRTSAQQRTFVASGEFTSVDALVSFLYQLMRDDLPAGRVAELVEKSSHCACTYTNGWLAQYAEYLAGCLRKTEVLP